MPDSTRAVAGNRSAEAHAAMGPGRGRASVLLEAGMDGDLDAWEQGLGLSAGVELTTGERERLDVLGGPPPLALEAVLRRLPTGARPSGHVRRLRLLARRYRMALDGDREQLRWVEAVLGHPQGTLGRADLLGPHGFPLHVQDLGADLEPGPLPSGWLDRVGPQALADIHTAADEPEPVWVLLRELDEDPQPN